MVPPWTPPPPSDPPPPPGEPPDRPAPPRRFSNARLYLGRFAADGDRSSLRRGLGAYVKRGYGGAGTTAQRFGGTARTAATLEGVLADPGASIDLRSLAQQSARALMDAVVEVVRPTDGTQDAEAERAAVGSALADLYDEYPDLTLDNLTADQRQFAIERYVAGDVFRRFELDVGAAVRKKADSTSTYLSRIDEIRGYIRESVSAAFRKLAGGGRVQRSNDVSGVVGAALRETFSVFESYAT